MKSNDKVRFTVTISQELNDWLVEQARLNKRSKSAQVAWILETTSLFDKTIDKFPDSVYYEDKSVRAKWLND